MREAGLKCISLSGIPRVFYLSLQHIRKTKFPPTTGNQLPRRPPIAPPRVRRVATQHRRHPVRPLSSSSSPPLLTLSSPPPHSLPTPSNIADITGPRAWSLWDSIYTPFSSKLISKLALSHPDLPITILSSHYGALLSDPPLPPIPGHVKVGRVLTSVVAMACLRAQQGVGLQVTSHVFGLKKSLGEGRDEQRIAGEEWLVTDEGCEWVLRSVDDIVAEVTGGEGSFAVGKESKL